ncbi:MAG TPA: hypothetical protein PLG22_07295 [Kiritimatiellia bacterium]|nr:hypothetical protein [Kiritimatiellia bacterium]
MNTNKAVMTVKYNGDPRQIQVDKPAGDWMRLDAFLLALGFRARRNAAREKIPGSFEFLTGDETEQETVVAIVRKGGRYLTSGNFDETFSI